MTEHEKSGIRDGCFVQEYVKEVEDVAKYFLFSDMISMRGAVDSRSLLLEVLNKPSVSESQLSEWLFSAIYLLDRCSIPLMSCAMKEINELKNDTIEDQKTIIKLRQQVIGKKNEEIDGVKKTETEELKTYFSVLLH